MRICDGRVPAWMRRLQGLAAMLGVAVAVSCSAEVMPVGPTGPVSEVHGMVLRHGDGLPVVGATVTFGSVSSLTDSSGAFRLSPLEVRGAAFLRASSPGYLERGTWVDIPAAGGPVTLEMVQDAEPFSLPFYRQFARNGYERPDALVGLDLWTVDPSFYVNVIVGDGTLEVPPDILDEVIAVLVNSVPALTGGRLKAAVERGRDALPLRDGWVNVSFYLDLGGVLGRASIGGNEGFIHLKYDPSRTSPPCRSLEAKIAEHEIEHTMGFFHTPENHHSDDCSGSARPFRIRHHASVAYSRPRLNRDEDIDPLGSRGAAAITRTSVIECSSDGRWSRLPDA